MRAFVKRLPDDQNHLEKRLDDPRRSDTSMTSKQDQHQHGSLTFLRTGKVTPKTLEFDRISLQVFGCSL
jgi:hypothetical protein